ncbi:hypothetical protein Tsubulata_001590 [Turnera subulata]|uniref:RING-type E3 ubiquitin transferase n=1 Tax=Turnera subulata TaxID=218843 RepID=A0A9Q0F148_9ROSI|nr:hypothetical protein Tsubulata_001590 [Turnera subulata]
MAVRHRKLFPASVTATNQTTDCSGFCDPECPYNCYPYADYYYLSPPPPPPPSFLPEEQHQLSPYVIVVIALLATFFLLVSYYLFASKSCAALCCSRRNRQPQPQENNGGEEFLDENRVDHPIWFITTIGLQQSIINSISVCKYKKGEGLIEGTECSVCLSEFQQDETLRLLPKCNHAFHISCIDTWLRSHTNCPLCRAHIVTDPPATPLASLNQNHGNLNSNPSNRMENSEIDRVTMANSQERNELHDNRNESAEAEEALQSGDDNTSKETANVNQNREIQVAEDHVGNDCVQTNDIKPLRRSSSMDSLRDVTMYLGLDIQSPTGSQGTSSDLTETTENTESPFAMKGNGRDHWSLHKPSGSSSIAQCLHKSPVPMKRSFSCGGRIFSSRQNRSLNSILPL